MNEDDGVMECEENEIDEEATESEDDGNDSATCLDRSDNEVSIGENSLFVSMQMTKDPILAWI